MVFETTAPVHWAMRSQEIEGNVFITYQKLQAEVARAVGMFASRADRAGLSAGWSSRVGGSRTSYRTAQIDST